VLLQHVEANQFGYLGSGHGRPDWMSRRGRQEAITRR
jgi:hypothetical protein